VYAVCIQKQSSKTHDMLISESFNNRMYGVNSKYAGTFSVDIGSYLNNIRSYGVATISRLLKIIGLFCRKSSLL